MSQLINVTRSSMPAFEEYCQEIRDLWDSHWLTNNGEKHIALQKAIHLNARHRILADISHRLLLTFGQCKWQLRVVEGVELIAHLREEETIPAPRALRTA